MTAVGMRCAGVSAASCASVRGTPTMWYPAIYSQTSNGLLCSIADHQAGILHQSMFLMPEAIVSTDSRVCRNATSAAVSMIQGSPLTLASRVGSAARSSTCVMFSALRNALMAALVGVKTVPFSLESSIAGARPLAYTTRRKQQQSCCEHKGSHTGGVVGVQHVFLASC